LDHAVAELDLGKDIEETAWPQTHLLAVEIDEQVCRTAYGDVLFDSAACDTLNDARDVQAEVDTLLFPLRAQATPIAGQTIARPQTFGLCVFG